MDDHLYKLQARKNPRHKTALKVFSSSLFKWKLKTLHFRLSEEKVTVTTMQDLAMYHPRETI